MQTVLLSFVFIVYAFIIVLATNGVIDVQEREQIQPASSGLADASSWPVCLLSWIKAAARSRSGTEPPGEKSVGSLRKAEGNF